MKTVNTAILYVSACFGGALHAASMLGIVPSITSLNVPANSSSSVQFTVTNNTTISLTGLTVTAGSQSGLSTVSDNCSNATLASNASCTFSVSVNGATAPASFVLSPRVCFANGAYCSMPQASNRVQVSVVPVTRQALAYYYVHSNSTNTDILVPVDASSLTVGTPAVINSSYDSLNPVVVSPDGTRVFVAVNGFSVNPPYRELNIFTAGSSPEELATINFTNPPLQDFRSISITPDGNKIYLATFEHVIYVVEKNGNTYTEGTSISGFNTVAGLTISPDGRYLYAIDYSAQNMKVIDTSNDTVIDVLQNSSDCVLTRSSYVTVSADGNTIYYYNDGNTGDPARIYFIYKNGSQYTCQNTGILIPDIDGYVSSLSVSSNGQYLYAAVEDLGYALINLQTGTETTYPIAGAYITGATASPDGRQLFLSNHAGANAYVVPLTDGIPSGAPQPIDVGGSQYNYNSSFVN